MTLRQTLGYAATAIGSLAAGWALHAMLQTPVGDAAAPVTRIVTGTRVAAAQIDSAPLIAVSSDGNVTLRVEQQPLEWVLEQIAQKSAWSDVKARATPATGASLAKATPAADAADCAQAVQPLSPAQAEQVMQAIQRGGDAQRFDGLLQARADGVPLADDTLKQLFETDASDAVRLLAFETYLEPRSGDPAALRSALEAAAYVPSAAIQGEAKRRLAELRESEQIDAASGQGASP